MDRCVALVGSLRMTKLANAPGNPDVIHEMDRCAALVGTLRVTCLAMHYETLILSTKWTGAPSLISTSLPLYFEHSQCLPAESNLRKCGLCGVRWLDIRRNCVPDSLNVVAFGVNRDFNRVQLIGQ